ncbi:hypothetical protein [Arthrobacter sp. AFG20]|uniref:hypothetical protein n=1 Tax=Arthrobacter sp. AFG20 TaxID=1688671 RepID=UPI000C9E2C2F|nr:hypothetical protein [Arthrobacter sp. AFG20]PNH86030.1 hypothetical protein CXZ05_02670 [Arthrobacter sp. AFG20]
MNLGNMIRNAAGRISGRTTHGTTGGYTRGTRPSTTGRTPSMGRGRTAGGIGDKIRHMLHRH